MIKKFFLSDRYDKFMFLICVVYCISSMAMLDMTSDFKNTLIFGSLPVLLFKLRQEKESRRILFLFLLSILIQIVSWAWSLQLLPNVAKDYPNIKHLTGLFLFVFIAMWVGGNRVRQLIILITYILSYIATALYDLAVTNSFQLAVMGKRIDYGMHNAQYTGMMAGVIMLICTYFFFALKRERFRQYTYGAITLFLIFALFSLIASQSRQVWIGLIITLACVPLFGSKKFNATKIIGLYSFILMVGFSALSIPSISKRLADDSTSISKIVSSDWDQVPMTSFGIRFNSLLESIHWIKQSPWVGASDTAIPQVIKQSDKLQSYRRTKDLGHLHNFYIEIFVSYGLLGIVFICVFYSHIVYNIKAHRSPIEFQFLLLFLVFYLLINNFESYNFKHYGVFTQNIILGSLYFFPRPRLAN